jgi:hypothetical protein
MSFNEADKGVKPIVESVIDEDDAALRAFGYVPSFKREFSNISTVSSFFIALEHISDCSDTVH